MSVQVIEINEESKGQRIDNFLLRTLKGVPKSRIYRAIKKGEVRINRGRVQAHYKLQLGDQVRIPPIRQASREDNVKPSTALMAALEARILYEDAQLLIIDKPAGLPVHGGSQVSAGLIETLRLMRPQQKLLELVHRIDKGTSGCLLVAKKREILVQLHQLLASNRVRKQYLLLVKGFWPKSLNRVERPLLKNILKGGERVVEVDEEGKPSLTYFRPICYWDEMTLMQAYPKTGRTHQIRVHAASAGHPILGDEKYGDAKWNEKIKKNYGIRRMMLHAASIEFDLEAFNASGLCARLGEEWIALFKQLGVCTK